jgi:hypothetical protein
MTKQHSAGWAIWVLRKAGFKKAAALLRRKSNPAAIDPNHPKAPTSHPHPPASPLPLDSLEKKIVAYANASLGFTGRMTYTMNWLLRKGLFHRKPGRFAKSKCDCSQFVAAILNWLGVKGLSDSDFTGSLLTKGKLISSPHAGCVAIWGPGTGDHAAFVTEHIKGGSDWYCVGFGHQGAPDRNTLSGMNAYFKSIGKPGVRYLSFA